MAGEPETPARGARAALLEDVARRASRYLDSLGERSVAPSYAHARNVVSEVITVGRAGTLVDWQGEGEQRAFVVRYNAESILNWKIERVGGRNEVTLVVLSQYGRNQIPGADVAGDEYAE